MPKTRKRGVTPEDFYLLRNVFDPQVSPDGKRVAYTVSTPDKESDEMRLAVYVAPLDRRGAPRRFTHGKRDHSPRWSPDGRYLAFVSDRGEKNQLFVAPLDGGEARKVTSAAHGLGQPAWSPDGTRVAYAARTGEYKEPKERKGAEKNAPRTIRDLRYRFDGIGYYDKRRFHIVVVDVESEEAEQITDGDWDDQQPSWSPDGKQIAFVSDRERERFDRYGRSDVYVVAATGGRVRRLTRARGTAANPQFSPDGRQVAFVGHEHGESGMAKASHLLVVPAEGGRAPRSLSAPLDRPVLGAGPAAGQTFSWTRDGKSILFLLHDRGVSALYRAGLANGSASRVLGGERVIDGFQLTPDGKRAVYTAAWLSEPAEVYEAPLAGNGRSRAISDANAEARAQLELSPPRRLTYKAADGLAIETFVLYPPGYRKGRRYPLSLQVHGGPHGVHPGTLPGVIAQYQAMASAGYVVLLPNPRGSQTYGDEFALMCVEDWGGKDYEDLMAGVDLLVERGVADPERLYVGGGSYGGFMTQWMVGHTDRFRAAMVAAPVADHIAMFGTTDIMRFSVYEHGGTPWEIPDILRERSPVTYLPDVKTPVLLLHWEGDLRCPIHQSEQIFQGLKALGKRVEFIRYPGGFHAVRTPSQEVDRVQRTIGWYERFQPRRAKTRRARAARPSRNGARPSRAKTPARAR